MELVELVWLIPALPLAAFLLLAFFGRRIGEPLAGWLATASMAGAFAAAVAVAAGLTDVEPERRFVQTLFTWLPSAAWRSTSASSSTRCR